MANDVSVSTTSSQADQPESNGLLINGRTSILAFLAIYACSLALLAWRINERPAFPYNWETYTIRGLLDYMQHPDWSVVRLNEGLMTDSGRSAVVVWPSWLGFTLFGQTWTGLRLPIVAIAAFAPPLTWVFGRKLYSDIVGMTAAALLATSQVFLLYGRTATNVGISLVPALLGYICLWMCVRPGQTRATHWLLLFQASLIINSFFYSPLRFLWPIALVLFAVELAMRRNERMRFAVALATTLVVLPMAIMLLRPGPMLNPQAAIKSYYYGRGEQIFRINDDRANYLPYFTPRSTEEREELERASGDTLAIRLIQRNASDLVDLVLNRGTKPAITNYWNPNGRLLPSVLVPFLLAGLAMLFWRCLREPRARLLLALFFGFSVPLVLTSQVHIGRLIFVVPVVALLCAVPIDYAVRFVAGRRSQPSASRILSWGGAVAGGLLVLVAGISTRNDWATDFTVPHMVFVTDRVQSLMAEYPDQNFVYVFGGRDGYEVESLRVAELEMLLHEHLTFADIQTGERRGDGDTSLLYGATLPLLADPDSIPDFCSNLYLVEPDKVEQFVALTERVAQAACGKSLVFNELP